MRLQFLLGLVTGVLVTGCGGGGGATDAGGADAAGPDAAAAADAAVVDATSPPDAAPDASPDAAPDASPDAGPACGDGVIDSVNNEVCDDGNTEDGDGCGGCQEEFGWLCGGEPTTCVPECVDGALVGDEPCDDANSIDGDGCTGCEIDPGNFCFGQPSTCLPTIDGPVVAINEIHVAGPDWVELYNPGASIIDLAGWTLSDATLGEFVFAAGTSLGPGAFMLLYEDDPGSFSFGLSAARDALLLRNQNGDLIDGTGWYPGVALPGHTLGRLPDGQGGFLALNTPTPGVSNQHCGNAALEGTEFCDGTELDTAACPTVGAVPGIELCVAGCTAVVCAEVVVNEVASQNDFVELYNHGDTTLDLSGWSISDETNPSFEFPPGTAVAAGAHLVFLQAAFIFGLGGNDALYLYAPDGVQVDVMDYPSDGALTGYGRCPDGTGTAQTLATATPGAANGCP